MWLFIDIILTTTEYNQVSQYITHATAGIFVVPNIRIIYTIMVQIKVLRECVGKLFKV